MSYNVHLEDDAGNAVGSLDRNYTYNVGPMFMAALGSTPNDWDGLKAHVVAVFCKEIVREFIDDPQKYEGMNPANGWGDMVGARGFILDIYDACRKRPMATVRVC